LRGASYEDHLHSYAGQNDPHDGKYDWLDINQSIEVNNKVDGKIVIVGAVYGIKSLQITRSSKWLSIYGKYCIS